MKKLAFAAAGLALLQTGISEAATVNVAVEPTSNFTPSSSLYYAQSFVVPSGFVSLTDISIFAYLREFAGAPIPDPEPLTLRLYAFDSSGSVDAIQGPSLFERTVSVLANSLSDHEIAASTGGVDVVGLGEYLLVLDYVGAASVALERNVNGLATSAPDYPGGVLWTVARSEGLDADTDWLASPQQDLAFALTFSDGAATVPTPPAFGLLLSGGGLIALLAAKRRRGSSAQGRPSA
ncbi:hypothetical protein P2H44_25410 [Albimonas sp. CAU 1670]|uniref:hypothetical protein n=1 Tax=Albimonas sp. CAU 1670 TaxID=3032599 RepID=UPI0023DBFCF5|nr:hypothetical protein [Albimonas sp. CAU 1670]MDF2235902.1 hypothetical protein [Albimonas sp. CAU 1670]